MARANDILTKEKGLTIVDADSLIDVSSRERNNSSAVKLDRDSFIICFVGRRGGGKTTAMTYMAMRAVAMYGMRIIANYQIEFTLRKYKANGDAYYQTIKAEELDFEKLLLFDDKYKDVLILIDEAPDIISHMASMSWKNRLMAAFTRQIRKNRNSLFLAAQDFEWIDKSLRWQMDIRCDCKDASKVHKDYRGFASGQCLFLSFYDESGQWTGRSTEDRLQRIYAGYKTDLCVSRKKLYPRFMWGDSEHEPVFDSWHQIDILESLRKVQLKLDPIRIGDTEERDIFSMYPVSKQVMVAALDLIKTFFANSEGGQIIIYKRELYKAIGIKNEKDKLNLGKLIAKCGGEGGGGGQTRWVDLTSFDITLFESFVERAV